jgi:hypothetical protein
MTFSKIHGDGQYLPFGQGLYLRSGKILLAFYAYVHYRYLLNAMKK